MSFWRGGEVTKYLSLKQRTNGYTHFELKIYINYSKYVSVYSPLKINNY